MTVNIKDRVSIDYIDGVADVRLARSDKMNALDEAMFFALIEAAEHVKATKGVRAAVLSGEGRAFCAGLDMGRFEAMKNQGEALAGMRDLTARTHGPANHPQYAAYCWRELPVPVIAAVHGVALGGGFQIALGADMRFATPDVKLSILEIKWGLVPDVAGTQLMRHLAREDVVRELTYTGRIFTGAEGKDYGFVTRVCADPRAEALSVAREIADKNPHAIRAAKRLLNLAVETDVRTGLKAESKEQLRLIGSSNQVEAVRAAMEKRAPKFADI
jgi:enoyl-CoA hydratase/carnithine racemase